MSTLRPPEHARLWLRAVNVVSPLTSAVLLVLAPKCPICVAAYLASFGVSASIALCLAPLLRPALAAFAVAGVLGLIWRTVRRRATAAESAAQCCCQPRGRPA
jgi:hypothetical protein